MILRVISKYPVRSSLKVSTYFCNVLEMIRIRLIILSLLIAGSLHAQHRVVYDSIPVNVPHYFVSTDIVYDVESIPTIAYEHFFVRNKRIKSLQLDLAYQVHYSNQYGVALSHGDKISVGVYQGPTAKFGYDIYSHRHRKHWMNYIAPALVMKYLWYDAIEIKTGRNSSDLSYKIQSEKCVATVPEFTIGAKRTNRRFCADFYCGIQLPLKFRNKDILAQYNSQLIPNSGVPYTTEQTTLSIAPVVGIKIGLIR